jgi:hypothetical protein
MRVPSLTIGNHIFKVFSVPADGTGLPNFKGSGDFGTSPFYGQLPGQASIQLAHAYRYGATHPQAQ